MEIVKFEQINKVKYKVHFKESDDIELYDDVIVKYNLLTNKIIDVEMYENILNYNAFIGSYYLAIKYLSKKLRTELDIRKFLKDKTSQINIDKVIKRLKKNGYINDFLFLKSYIHDKYYLSRDGNVKIFNDLTKMGFLKDYIECNLTIYDWKKKLEALAIKKMRLNNKDSNYMLKLKTKEYLISLGYDSHNIDLVFENMSFPDREIETLKYNIDKFKKKNSLKYNEDETKTRVINSLYKKGFKIDDIKRFYDEN